MMKLRVFPENPDTVTLSLTQNAQDTIITVLAVYSTGFTQPVLDIHPDGTVVVNKLNRDFRAYSDADFLSEHKIERPKS